MANEFKIKKGLIVTGASGGTVVDIQGSQGQLFSVTDDLSGSIFAVSDISGVPILDVNSNGTVTIDGSLTGDDATFSKKLLLNSPDYGQHLAMRRGIYGYDTIITGTRVDFSPTADTLSFKFLANLQTTGDVSVSGGDLNVGSSTTVNSVINMLGTGDSFIEKDTGNDLYFANNVSDKDIKFRVKDDGTNVIALTIDGSEGGDATFAAQAFSAATSSGDGSSTLTTKGYVDGLITGATIYRGAWDPSGGGYGSPDLSGVTQTSGYYYICSAAGTAEPNGTGTEPDTWAVGDWVIYNDVSGTGQWQKIDNSSVLSGVGTGQTVALWEGAGSVTDSETLGNAPITVSGNDTTFAGGVSIATDAGLAATAPIFNTSSTTSRAAYFRGNNILQFQNTAGANKWEVVGREGTYYVYKNDGAGSGMKYQINTNGDHTFTGTVTLASGDLRLSGTGRIQGVDTVTDNTDAANKLYVDNAAAAVPIGNYLPLAGGTMTGNLNINTSTNFPLLFTGTNSTYTAIGIRNTGTGDAGIYMDGINGDFSGSDYAFIGQKDEGYLLYNIGVSSPLPYHVFTGGNVGIGTTTPNVKLEVVGTLSANSSDFANGVSGSRILMQTVGTGDTYGKIQVNDAGGISNNNLSLQPSGGNVGIGTTSPQSPLHIYKSVTGGVGGELRLDNNNIAVANKTRILFSDGGGASGSSDRGAIVCETEASPYMGQLQFQTGIGTISTKMIILGNGSVGIGTTSPGAKLVISGGGGAISDNGFQINSSYGYSGTGVLEINPSAASHIPLSILSKNGQTANLVNVTSFGGTAGNLFNVQSSGNVGIGTSTPNAKLDIQGTQGQLFSVTDDLSGEIFAVSDISGVPIMTVNSSGVSYFDGKVGIGIDNPTVMLQVDGNAYIGTGATDDNLSLRVYGNNAGASRYVELAHTNASSSRVKTDNSYLSLESAGYILLSNSGLFYGDTLILNNKRIKYGESNGSWRDVMYLGTDNVFRIGTISTMSSGGDTAMYHSGSEKVRINSTGVGIGTTSPGAKLEVEGDATSDDTPQLIVASGGADNNAIIHFTDDDGGQVNAIGALEGNMLTFASQSEMIFKTGTSSILGNTDTKMTIATNGNVGIGTTSPGSELEVNGSIDAGGDGYLINGKAWAFESSDVLTLGDWDGQEFSTRIMDNYSSEVLRVANGGVGIGVTNPSAKLQVYRDDATLAADLAQATSRASVKIRSSSTDGAHLAISQGASGCTQLQVSSTNGTTPRNIKIQPFGGNVGIGTGTANPSDKLAVMGNVVATNFILSSDERKKTKIKDLTCNNIDVNWRSFELKQHEGEYRTGVIAQELEQSHPEFVKTDNEGFKSVKYIDLLIAKIAELEARLEKLEK